MAVEPHAPSSQIEKTHAVQPEHILAFTAIVAVLLYALAFVRPFGLLQYWKQPLLDLQRMSSFMPNGRWELLFAFLAQGLLYVIGWQAAQRTNSRAAWAIVLGGGAAMAAILLFVLPFDAADIFDNIVHGRILGIYGQNPFLAVGGQFPNDPFVPYMAWAWSPSAYGPFWEVLAAVTARLAGNGIVANVIAFKLLCGLFLAVSVGIVVSILREVAPERALAGALLLAWNPIVLYETLGHGHNDIVMVFWVLAAARSLLNRNYTMAILSLLGGALVKFIPILFLPAAGLLALRDLPDNRARLRFFAVTAVASLVVVVLAYGAFWRGTQVLTIERRETMLTTSLPAFVWAWLLQHAHLTMSADDLGKLVSRAAAVLTALFALWEGLRAWRDRTWLSFSRSALHVSLFYLMATCTWFQNWYAIWPLGLAALFPNGPEMALAQLFGFATLSKPFVFGPMVLWINPLPDQLWREVRLGPGVMAVPWVMGLYTLFVSWRDRHTHRTEEGRPMGGALAQKSEASPRL